MSSGYDPRPLVPYLRQLGVPYLYEQQDIMAQVVFTHHGTGRLHTPGPEQWPRPSWPL